MKKIVALVLSLVMALSLATVAFASTGTVLHGLKGKNVDENMTYSGSIDSVKAIAKKDGTGSIAYYTRTYVAFTEDAYVMVKGDVQVYVPVSDSDYYAKLQGEGYAPLKDENSTTNANYVEKNVDFYAVDYLIPCEQDDAQAAIYKNGAFSTWVFFADDESAARYDVIASAQAATSEKANCTRSQYLEDGYMGENGHFYVDGGSVALNVDGKIVFAKDVTGNFNYVIAASHIFAKGVKNTTTGYDVATCLICKGEFAATNNEAVATKNGYKISTGFEYKPADAKEVYDSNKYANGYDFAWGQQYAGSYNFCWALKAGTTQEAGTKPDTTKDGVNSAKTFDAGIAMYVGMSLLSVAGSAVVIGKKKEF